MISNCYFDYISDMKQLYDWQLSILQDIIINDDHDQHGNNTIVNKISLLDIPCGCGKSELFCHYARIQQYDQIFIVSPLKAHVKQNMRRLEEGEYLPGRLKDGKYVPEHKFITYHSDQNSNLSADKISEYLDKYPKCVIGITSIAIKNRTVDLDSIKHRLSNVLMIFDEVHNLLPGQEQYFVFDHFKKVLLATATPTFVIKRLISDRERKTISIKKAIQNGYISDYTLYIPDYTDENTGSVEDINIASMESKIKFLMNGIKKTECKKVIVYLKDINECNKYYEYLSGYSPNNGYDIVNNTEDTESDSDTESDVENSIESTGILRKYFNNRFWIGMIHSKLKFEKRESELENFQSNKQQISILLNVRILDECIDVPKCDGVFITKLIPESDIRTVQRIFRSVRLERNKRTGVAINNDKNASIFLWCDKENEMLDTLVYLKDKDGTYNFKNKVKLIPIDRENDAHHEEMNAQSTFVDFDTVAISEDELWQMKFLKMCTESVKRRRLVDRSDDIVESTNEPIGMWVQHQQKLFKNSCLSPYRFDVLSSFSYFKNWLSEFHETYDSLQFYGIKDELTGMASFGVGISLNEKNCKYAGDFVNNKANGYVVEKKDKTIYVGQMKHGKKDGYGVIYQQKSDNKPDVLIFKGNFKDGEKHGSGTKYDPIDQKPEYEGEYMNGKMHGKGIQWKRDKGNIYKVYEGDFVNNKKNGYGKLFNRYNECISDKDTKWKDDKQVHEDKNSFLKRKAFAPSNNLKKEETSSDDEFVPYKRSKRY